MGESTPGDILHHGRIQQRCGISQIFSLALCDLPQDAAHDLSAAGLGQSFHELDLIRLGDRSDDPADREGDIPAGKFLVAMHFTEDDISVDALPLDIMGIPYDGTFHDTGVHIDGVLHLGRTDAVTADVEYVVHTPGDPVKSVLITQRTISGEIEFWIGGKIVLLAALMVAVGRPDHRRPG